MVGNVFGKNISLGYPQHICYITHKAFFTVFQSYFIQRNISVFISFRCRAMCFVILNWWFNMCLVHLCSAVSGPLNPKKCGNFFCLFNCIVNTVYNTQ